jgi:hypothetical protein
MGLTLGTRRTLAILPWSLLIALAGCTLLLTQDYWWPRQPGATVSYGGSVSNGSDVYRAPNRDLMVSLKEDEGNLYVVYRGPGKVSSCRSV